MTEEFASSGAHESGDVIGEVCEEGKGGGCGEFLTLEEERRLGCEEKQGGECAVASWAGLVVESLAVGGIGDLVVVLYIMYIAVWFDPE